MTVDGAHVACGAENHDESELTSEDGFLSELM